MMQTRLSRTAAILAALIIAAAGCSHITDGQRAPTKIGAILPLTGENALYGENERKGITLAIEQVHKRWPALNLDVLYEDNKGEAKTAALAFQKLRMEGVKYFIDDAMSSITFALVPSLGPDAIMVSTGATNPRLSGASPYFFRIWNSDAEEGVQAADLTLKVIPTAKRLAIVYINNDYGVGLRDVYSRQVAKIAPSAMVRAFSYEGSQTNLRNLAALVKGYAPDAVYLVGYGPQSGLVVKDLRSYGVSAHIISTVTTEDPKFLERSGPAGEGTVYLYPKDPTGREAQTFRELYSKAYGSQPGILVDDAYDAALLYAAALGTGAKNPAQVQDYFRSMPVFEGASGVIQFDRNGDVHKPYDLKQVSKGAFAAYAN